MSKRTNRRATIRLPRSRRFTIADVIALNASLNDQTVRTYVRNQIASRNLCVDGTLETPGRGRPAFVLVRA